MDGLDPLIVGFVAGLVVGIGLGYVLRRSPADRAIDPMARFTSSLAHDLSKPRVDEATRTIQQGLTPEDAEHLRALLDRGRTIEAIKVLRDRTGIGLREAKAAIDEMKRTSARH